jgi:UDP-N-acetylglucosamine acyltransferase
LRSGRFCVIEEGVEIHAGARLASHVVLRKGTVVGKNVQIDSFSVIGGEPQYRAFEKSTVSGVIIGENTIIRESVTINRGIPEGSNTIIGSNCLLMACSHVAHDCVLGDYVTLTNAVLLGGHVTIGAYANLGGASVVHQRTRIGESAMVGGNATITGDVPPYIMAANRNEAAGIEFIRIETQGV